MKIDYKVVEKITNWWGNNPLSRYGKVNVTKLVKGDDVELILSFGNSFPINLFDLKDLLGGYKVIGRDVSDGYNEGVCYNISKL